MIIIATQYKHCLDLLLDSLYSILLRKFSYSCSITFKQSSILAIALTSCIIDFSEPLLIELLNYYNCRLPLLSSSSISIRSLASELRVFSCSEIYLRISPTLADAFIILNGSLDAEISSPIISSN